MQGRDRDELRHELTMRIMSMDRDNELHKCSETINDGKSSRDRCVMSTWLLVLFSSSYTTSFITRDVSLYTCSVRTGLRIRSALFCEASSSSISEKHVSIGFKETLLGSTPRLISKSSGLTSGSPKTHVALVWSQNLSPLYKCMS